MGGSIIIIIAFIVVVINLIVDLIYQLADPKETVEKVGMHS